MKANEAPKSKFVYPDKLYARANNNITLDISYAPQTLDAIEYIRTDAFVEKAEKWMKENFVNDQGLYCVITDYNTVKEMIEDFKNYMEGE